MLVNILFSDDVRIDNVYISSKDKPPISIYTISRGNAGVMQTTLSGCYGIDDDLRLFARSLPDLVIVQFSDYDKIMKLQKIENHLVLSPI